MADGREWQLLTSAFVADRPAVPSVVGFTIVGLAALALAGARILWTAAVAGHVLATVVVYAALDAAQVTVSRPDYGTSAIIAAWIGVVACCLWRRGAARARDRPLRRRRPSSPGSSARSSTSSTPSTGSRSPSGSASPSGCRGYDVRSFACFLRGGGFFFTTGFFGSGALAGAVEAEDAGARVPNCCDQSAAPA